MDKKLPITISLTIHDIKSIDAIVDKQKETDDQANRSKVIRSAVRKQLNITPPPEPSTE